MSASICTLQQASRTKASPALISLSSDSSRQYHSVSVGPHDTNIFVLLHFHDTLHLGLLQEAIFGVKMKHDCSAAGQPEFAIDVDNVKPTGLVVGAALIMLVLGKPLTGSRAFGGAVFSLPQMGDCKAMVGLYQMSICYYPGAPRWCAGCAALSRIAVEQLLMRLASCKPGPHLPRRGSWCPSCINSHGTKRNLVAAGDSMLSLHAGGGEGDGRAEGQGHEPLNKAAECGLAAVVPVQWLRQDASPKELKGGCCTAAKERG